MCKDGRVPEGRYQLWVSPIAAILRQRPSSPDAGDKSGLYAKEAGNVVVRQRRKFRRRKRKTNKLTDKNGAAKQEQTADEDIKQKRLIMWPWHASYLTRWSDRNQPSLSRSTHVVVCSIVRRI